MWAGSVTHAVIAQELVPRLRSALSMPSRRELVAAVVDLGARQLAFSEAGRFNDDGVTKGATGKEFAVLEWDVIPDRERPADPLNDLALLWGTNLGHCDKFSGQRSSEGRRWLRTRIPFRLGISTPRGAQGQLNECGSAICGGAPSLVHRLLSRCSSRVRLRDGFAVPTTSADHRAA